MPVTITDGYGDAVRLGMMHEQDAVALRLSDGGALALATGLPSGVMTVTFALASTVSTQALVAGLGRATVVATVASSSDVMIAAHARADVAVSASAAAHFRIQGLLDDIALLFANGEEGAWLEAVSGQVFTDTAGTTAAGLDDGIGNITALAGTVTEATQSDSNKRPLFKDPGAEFDLVDDNLSMDFTGSGGFDATLVQGMSGGIIHAKVNVPDGPYDITKDPGYFPSGNLIGYVLREGDLTAGEVSSVSTALQDKGAGADFAGVTSMGDWFQSRSDLVELYSGDWDTSSVITFTNFIFKCSNLITLDVSNWDTSNVTNFERFARSCSNLTALDVSNWDTSSVTTFRRFVLDCPSLTTLDVSNWDTSNVTNFELFAWGCSNLTALDVSNWDTSNVTNFERFAESCSSLTTVTVNGGTGSPFADSPCTNYEDAFADTNLTQQSIDNILVAIEAAGTSNGVFAQSGGSAPSATGEAAIDAMRGRGWTISVTGGY